MNSGLLNRIVVVTRASTGIGAGLCRRLIDPGQWDRLFAVNVKGVWMCRKAVMPAMRLQGCGSTVDIAAMVTVAGQLGYVHYVASKGAVLWMTNGLAKEVGKGGCASTSSQRASSALRCRRLPVRMAAILSEGARPATRAEARRPGHHRAVPAGEPRGFCLRPEDRRRRRPHHVLRTGRNGS